ncbi:UPF0184 protein C9orf16 homolog [Athene cunicularia]|uniref:UPF0184 protein C9orf16 homolog n=1 Tax=Athene cunicularia TaxID=194338 RepID=UPI000EF71C5E|nr:UPF0184 protein C9orf16 homolog [Athene cunicularia]
MVYENPLVELDAPHLGPFGNNDASTSTFGLISAPATATAALFWQSDPIQALVKHTPAWEPYAKYAEINSMLDQISSCLDHLEEKNDYLHACLKELLESNRQTRLEFQQQSEQQNTQADVQGSQPPG